MLPLDLVAAIVDGLIASGRLNDLEADALKILTGSQKLVYPSDGEDEEGSHSNLNNLDPVD